MKEDLRAIPAARPARRRDGDMEVGEIAAGDNVARFVELRDAIEEMRDPRVHPRGERPRAQEEIARRDGGDWRGGPRSGRRHCGQAPAACRATKPQARNLSTTAPIA